MNPSRAEKNDECVGRGSSVASALAATLRYVILDDEVWWMNRYHGGISAARCGGEFF